MHFLPVLALMVVLLFVAVRRMLLWFVKGAAHSLYVSTFLTFSTDRLLESARFHCLIGTSAVVASLRMVATSEMMHGLLVLVQHSLQLTLVLFCGFHPLRDLHDSIACASVNFFYFSRRCCVALFAILHTRRSCTASFRVSLNLQ